ncbi:tryptophan halogenase family protein [Sphingomonas sp. HT-1]|uniref:tryptophan halogenase family protein n=1 Tax=unclassified Sphingomonas TaxID=196159 RepID=UPI00036A8E7C|nr:MULTISPECIES: tryptophan halogenase family protein [unclassified Sphingomonas]KTF68534.1 tryptophan halogenase [Sphingomonas sp. WG]
MRQDLIQRVVIVGGGTAGWMAAAALGKLLGRMPEMRIELVESAEIGTIGVGEATIPHIALFNTMLGIDEAEFVRATQATYKLGIEFVDWRRIGHRYVHPFGVYGLDMLGVEFHHFWLKARSLGATVPLDAYSIGASAGMRGRFTHPRPELPNSPLAKLGYAFQFDAALYATYLRNLAETLGVIRTEGRIVNVLRDANTGHVSAVRLEDGTDIAGDLFIDCSGFRGLLIEQAMGATFQDWTDWLPCDRAVAVPCALGGDRMPLTRSIARAAGWQWRIPLQHRIGNGYVYAGAFLSDDEAAATLLAHLDGPPLAEPRQLAFRAGHRDRAWIGNVVAIGLAGGFLEPLESTSIHLVQSGIGRLMALFPSKNFDAAEIDRFNRETAREYADIRDFLILHYKATERDDSAFWRRCRDLTPPDGLREKIAMFRANGRIFRDQHELFPEASWLAVMNGQGIEPQGYHPIADLLSDEETLKRLNHIAQVIDETANTMPLQDAYLRELGCQPAPLRRVS